MTARDDNGAPLRMVGVIQDINERRRYENQQRFLAEAGILLSTSLDYERTLSTIASLAVREFADWCGVDVVDDWSWLERHAALLPQELDQLRTWYAAALAGRAVPLVPLKNLLDTLEKRLNT